MRAAALFCGYGGASRGMRQAGLEVVAAYDWSAREVEAHRWLEPDVPCEQRDVSTVTADELRGLFVWASPSCKPWSTANRSPKRGTAHAEYYDLTLLAEQCRYSAVTVIENVMGLLHSREGRVEMARLHTRCHELGLNVQVLVPFANEHGVSQFRQRAMIVMGAPYVVLPRGVAIPATYAVMATEHKGHYMRSSGGLRTQVRFGRALVECARLQHLPIPAGFSKRAAAEMLGNAVPPPLAEAVCRAVLGAVAHAPEPTLEPRSAVPA